MSVVILYWLYWLFARISTYISLYINQYSIYQFVLNCFAEVPRQKMPNLAGPVCFQTMVSALGVMNELKKGERLVLGTQLMPFFLAVLIKSELSICFFVLAVLL